MTTRDELQAIEAVAPPGLTEFTVFRRPHKSGKGWQYKAVETASISDIWPPRGYKRCCVIDAESRRAAEACCDRGMRDTETAGCDVKETLYTIRWFVSGHIDTRHLTIGDVWREAVENDGALEDDGFIVRTVNGARHIIAIVTKEESK